MRRFMFSDLASARFSWSKVGYEQAAKISPVMGSIATADPYLAPVSSTALAMASSAAFWMVMSSEVIMSVPFLAGTLV